MDNPITKNFLKFAWFLTKQDLGIEEKVKTAPIINKPVYS